MSKSIQGFEFPNLEGWSLAGGGRFEGITSKCKNIIERARAVDVPKKKTTNIFIAR
jgi:hypothetical protein